MKDIKGFEGLYAITKDGRIWSYHGNIWLKKRKHSGGYLSACLWKDGKCSYHYVHRLVAQTYISNPQKYNVVNHVDGNKENNYVSNLEWCTQKQNCLNTIKLGRTTKGEKNPMAKLSEKDVMEIKSVCHKIHHRELAKRYNVCIGTIRAISQNRLWKFVNPQA